VDRVAIFCTRYTGAGRNSFKGEWAKLAWERVKVVVAFVAAGMVRVDGHVFEPVLFTLFAYLIWKQTTGAVRMAEDDGIG